MEHGFLRVAACSPHIEVADCDKNTEIIISESKKAAQNGAKVVVFPELSITGYTCGDLFLQRTLQKGALDSLLKITRETKDLSALIAVGLPIATGTALYNCAALLFQGRILAIVPKTYIPNYSEFYEKRYFSSAPEASGSITLCEEAEDVPFSTKILVADEHFHDFVLSAEICEDLWTPLPPSTLHTLAGASIIVNLSASNEVIGKAQYRRTLVSQQSARTISAYIYASAGHDESTTDLVFAGHDIIAENGKILAESTLFEDGIVFADIDLELLAQERRKNTSFANCTDKTSLSDYQVISVSLSDSKKSAGFGSQSDTEKKGSLIRKIEKHPFVPHDNTERSKRCKEVIELQSEGLAKRLRHIKAKSAVIGLSGGLDSTLALLVACRAADKCSLSRDKIISVTMPCFGTTGRTYKNACALAKHTGSTLLEIPIADAVKQHFSDIKHDINNHDITFENAQARERTQVLMDVSNQRGGIVIGTGDLSELALGWCTYNADQMSMYGVNSSIPKTLVRHLVSWFSDEAKENSNQALSDVLKDILDTPVSPELLPPEKDGTIAQKTEDLVGPYELHDFFLYYVLRFGFSPSKIYFLACNAFKGVYEKDFIKKWLSSFYKRFFSQQFKRSCMPDGAKVGTVSLSPRGDWRMPSDACASLWLKEAESL